MQARRCCGWTLTLLAAVILLAGCGAVSLGPPTPEETSPQAMPPTPLSAGTPTETPATGRTPTQRPTPTMTPFKAPSPVSDDCLKRATFGDPAASPYILPYPAGAIYRVTQSYCNPRGSHQDQLAYDLDMAVGDDVIACRAGTVVELWEEATDTGYEAGNNYLFILHDDGTVAMYAHLRQGGIDVEVGDYVEQGQRVAASGNSGTLGTPHLHLGVYASWPNRDGYDVPVNFRNAAGPLDERGGLRAGRSYKARPWD